MNIKALITTLAILGSSSIAMARPVTYSASADASWSFGTRSPVVRDHRYYEPVAPQPSRFHQRGDWQRGGMDVDFRYGYEPAGVLLEENASFGFTDYRKDIMVGSQAGRFRALRIDSEGGHTYLMKVVVEFSDNSRQQIDLNRTLRGDQSMTLRLNGRKGIHRVLIYRADGDAAHNMRQRHYGGFTVSAI